MNLSVNGHSKVPPGFRFHPTEEELLHYYLRKKVASEKVDLDVIRDVDLNKLEPWDIQEICKIGSTPQNDWYFFSHKDKKYPTGTRTNRATAAGFWKATGRDKVIHSSLQRIGMRKTLVFYRGRAPHGQKSDWIMHEYRLDDPTTSTNASTLVGDSGAEEGWVVCRVFKKKNYHKALETPLTSSTSNPPRNDGVLDQILMYMGRSSSSFKQESHSGSFLHLPELESPTMNNPPLSSISSLSNITQHCSFKSPVNDLIADIEPSSEPSDWVTLDRLVASQLNGQSCKQYSSYNEDFSFSFDHEEMNMHGLERETNDQHHQDVSCSETDLWNFPRSSSSLSSPSSDPLCHLSV